MLQRVTPAFRGFSMAAAHRALARIRQPAAVIDVSRGRLLAVGGLDRTARPDAATSPADDPFPDEVIDQLAEAAALGWFAPGGPRTFACRGRSYRFSPLPAANGDVIALVRMDPRAATQKPEFAAPKGARPSLSQPHVRNAPSDACATTASGAIEFARPSADAMAANPAIKRAAAHSNPTMPSTATVSVTTQQTPPRRPPLMRQVSDADQATLADIARRIRAGHREPGDTPVTEHRSARVAKCPDAESRADAPPAATDRASDEASPPDHDNATTNANASDCGGNHVSNRELVHELRTPLAAITTLADMLAEDVVAEHDTARRRLYAQRIADTARHAISVVEAMSAGQPAPIAQPIAAAEPMQAVGQAQPASDIATAAAAADATQAQTPDGDHMAHRATVDDIVDETCSAMRPMAEQNGLDLMIDLAGDATRLTIAARPLRQMIINLVGNAIRHTSGTHASGTHASGAGTVLVATRTAPDGGGIVDILDDGPGFSARAMMHGQNNDGPGRQGRAGERGASADGHGLGLMIVHRLAREHGVTFELDSQPGHGTRATLRLPALPRGTGLPTMASLHD